jgi:hypothetical protein
VIGPDQYGPAGKCAHVDTVEIDRALVAAIQADCIDGGDAMQCERGEVVSVGVPMERDVEVGAGVGAHRHQSDLEGDPRAVDLLGGFT